MLAFQPGAITSVNSTGNTLSVRDDGLMAQMKDESKRIVDGNWFSKQKKKTREVTTAFAGMSSAREYYNK